LKFTKPETVVCADARVEVLVTPAVVKETLVPLAQPAQDAENARNVFEKLSSTAYCDPARARLLKIGAGKVTVIAPEETFTFPPEPVTATE
jgi:hypothetical protein